LALRDRVADRAFHVSASRDSSMLSILPVAGRTAHEAPPSRLDDSGLGVA
jgi:hypothetical protein